MKKFNRKRLHKKTLYKEKIILYKVRLNIQQGKNKQKDIIQARIMHIREE